MVISPRGRDRLRDELHRLQRAGIQTLFPTLENWEAHDPGRSEEAFVSQQLGFDFLSYPIKDGTITLRKEIFDEFVRGLRKRLQTGERIGVHRRRCIGRWMVVAACTLVKLGWRREQALDAIGTARGCSVPDTDKQRDRILDFGACQ